MYTLQLFSSGKKKLPGDTQSVLEIDNKTSGNRVSVVTVSNRPQNIKQIVLEVLKQEIGCVLEHVIILDGVNVNPSVLKEIEKLYTNKSGNIKIFRAEPQPEKYLFEKLGTLRNFGADKSSGQFLAFWDDDNQWASEHLASLHEPLINTAFKAAHSIRYLMNTDGTPHQVSEGKYPWITDNPRNSLRMYNIQKSSKIIYDDSNKVHDKYGYANGTACSVDTGEWLFRREMFDASSARVCEGLPVTRFYEFLSIDKQMNGYTDDQLLGLAMLERGIRPEEVYCSEKPTLFYAMGGNSQVHTLTNHALSNESPDFPLIGVPPTALDLLSLTGLAIPAETYKRVIEHFHSVEELSIQFDTIATDARVPLFPLGVQTNTTQVWEIGSDDKIESLFTKSPYAVGLSTENQKQLACRLQKIQWFAIGDLAEPAIRNHFNLSDKQPISVIVFGSTIWSPVSLQPNDMDMLVIIEDVNDTRVNVGSDVCQVNCFGINDFMPVGFKLNNERIDVSIVGRGAILNRQLHSGDLTNIAMWSHMGGLCLKGNHLLNEVSDYLYCQEIFVSLGFKFKSIIGNYDSKSVAVFIRSTQSLIYLHNKYGLPTKDLEEQLNGFKVWKNNIKPRISEAEADVFLLKWIKTSELLKKQTQSVEKIIKIHTVKKVTEYQGEQNFSTALVYSERFEC